MEIAMIKFPKFLKTLVVASAAIGGLLQWSAPADAQTKPNIVVMGEDADEDTVPRGNRIFNRVTRELSETMNLRGYNIYDETAVAMGISQPGRVRRRDAELIDVARAVQTPPLDVVAIFQIYASAQKSQHSDIVRPEVRIPGRLLNVRTGQSLGSFEVTGLQLPPLPLGCDRECLLERVGAEAKLIAGDLAQALTQKLDGVISPRRAEGGSGGTVVTETAPGSGSGAVAPGGSANAESCGGLPTAFVIRVTGFSSTETQAVEEYIRAFRCYDHHRTVRASSSQTEYWYETRIDGARLNRNLRLMLEHMNVGGQVTMSGNSFAVSKVATR
jgi:hypothetical protein